MKMILAAIVALSLAEVADSFSLSHRPRSIASFTVAGGHLSFAHFLKLSPRCYTKLHSLFSDQVEEEPSEFDVILVGSGNGAMGFLSKYLETTPDTAKILVLEQGKNFFFTSDKTHQNSWTKAYSEGNIFKLHNRHLKTFLRHPSFLNIKREVSTV